MGHKAARLLVVALVAVNALATTATVRFAYQTWELRKQCQSSAEDTRRLMAETERLNAENIDLMRQRNKAQKDCIELVNKIYSGKR